MAAASVSAARRTACTGPARARAAACDAPVACLPRAALLAQSPCKRPMLLPVATPITRFPPPGAVYGTYGAFKHRVRARLEARLPGACSMHAQTQAATCMGSCHAAADGAPHALPRCLAYSKSDTSARTLCKQAWCVSAAPSWQRVVMRLAAPTAQAPFTAQPMIESVALHRSGPDTALHQQRRQDQRHWQRQQWQQRVCRRRSRPSPTRNPPPPTHPPPRPLVCS